MNDHNPPPPKVGDTYYHKTRVLYPGKYHVRAIVDAQKNKKYAWIYQVVFARYVAGKGWAYIIENSHVLGLGLYVPCKKTPKKGGSLRRH